MNERQQFTFYRSFWEAAKVLPPKDKNAVLDAICAYALDGELRALNGTAAAIFSLIKPNLDASKRKAESGKKGGETGKQNESKSEANAKQTESEIEKENECSFLSQPEVGTAQKPKKPKKVFAWDSKPYKCAVYLDESIRDRLPTKPKTPETTLQSWADAFDRVNRIDGQDWELIAAVLEFSQEDDFWRNNILSGDKFRKQFFTLLAKMPKA